MPGRISHFRHRIVEKSAAPELGQGDILRAAQKGVDGFLAWKFGDQSHPLMARTFHDRDDRKALRYDSLGAVQKWRQARQIRGKRFGRIFDNCDHNEDRDHAEFLCKTEFQDADPLSGVIADRASSGETRATATDLT
jgi:hypothetical protein